MTSPETDAEDFVIAYLVSQNVLAAGQISARMLDNVSTPFILVQRVAGDDDYLFDSATVDLDSFATDQTTASTVARTAHHAMRQLHPKTRVTMPDSSTVTPYSPAKTEQTPIFMPWESSGGGAILFRYVGRYRIQLRLPKIVGF